MASLRVRLIEHVSVPQDPEDAISSGYILENLDVYFHFCLERGHP